MRVLAPESGQDRVFGDCDIVLGFQHAMRITEDEQREAHA